MTKKLFGFGLAVLSSTLLLAPGYANELCSELEGVGTDAHVLYLGQEHSARNLNCIRYAIAQLGERRHVPAADVLTRYLDYRITERPDPDPFKNKMRWVGTDFPAVGALFLIGKPSVPALVSLISNTDISSLARRNAIALVHVLFADDEPECVSVLVHAGRDLAKTNAVAGFRLQKAAQEAAKLCSSRQSSDCNLALYR